MLLLALLGAAAATPATPLYYNEQLVDHLRVELLQMLVRDLVEPVDLVGIVWVETALFILFLDYRVSWLLIVLFSARGVARSSFVELLRRRGAP